ncbi:MAG TPA: DUF2145 domain-containing protein [Desulfobulbaceae bacterium]|nr:DUF2145 domain-containing protein [Desulfobulbaceae bacterium]
MKCVKIVFFTLAIFFLVMSANAAFCGSSQSGGDIHFKPEEIIKFAKKVEKTMAQEGARVAILARVGQPRNKLPEGILFTHVAFAVYSQITTADGRMLPGYAIYNLYQRADEPNISDLIVDYPVDFFAAVPLLEAGIVIPSPELQDRLLAILTSPTYKELHNPHYSTIANPFTLNFQNCTEHTLDVIMAAIYQTNDIKVIKTNEKAYFQPQPVNVGRLKLFFGSMFSSDIATSDHSDDPVTATFTTISRFLNKYDTTSKTIIVKPDPS